MQPAFRVFGTNVVELKAPELLEALQQIGLPSTGKFQADDEGWLRVELEIADGTRLTIEHFLVSEEGIRSELNTWAAWVETQESNPLQSRLMQHLISTREVFLIRQSEGTLDEEMTATEFADAALALTRLLAKFTNGVYQVDGQGFFALDGMPLVLEQ